MLGFEHSIANQFLIPMAIAVGAPISAHQFVLHNLIPATIGNWLGGAVFMATTYAFIYGRPAKQFIGWLEAWKSPKQAAKAAGPTPIIITAAHIDSTK
jgi:hypothetical protein